MPLNLEHPRLRGIIRDRRVAAANEWLSTARGSGGQFIPIYTRSAPVYQRHVAAAEAGGGFDIRRVGSLRGDSDIDTVILHVTTGQEFRSAMLPSPSSDSNMGSAHTVDRINAHFVVLNDGVILYTRDVGHVLNNRGGRRGIDIEFAGCFGLKPNPRGPSPRHVAALDPKESLDRLERRTIEAARALLQSLRDDLRVRFIHPHGQLTAAKRDTCPGPDIWVNIGHWACDHLGLSTGGRGGEISGQQNNFGYYQPY